METERKYTGWLVDRSSWFFALERIAHKVDRDSDGEDEINGLVEIIEKIKVGEYIEMEAEMEIDGDGGRMIVLLSYLKIICFKDINLTQFELTSENRSILFLDRALYLCYFS